MLNLNSNLCTVYSRNKMDNSSKMDTC